MKLRELRIKCLETDNGDILDGALLVSDCFDPRESAGSSQWTVCVRRQTPTVEELRLLGNIRFSSIVTNSGARPPKRLHDEMLGRFGSNSFRSPPEQYALLKRQRVERGSVLGTFRPDEPVASVERTAEEHAQRSPSAPRQKSPILVEDSQKSQRTFKYLPDQSSTVLIFLQIKTPTTPRNRYKQNS